MTTVLGHAIGARYELENGILNAIVLPHVLRFNIEAAHAGVAKVAAALGLPDAELEPQVLMTIQAVETLFGKLGVPRRLRDVGVPRDALFGIASSAIGDWFLRGNPRPVRSIAELHQVLEDAW
jgi:alcohol dehydrogenase class IV